MISEGLSCPKLRSIEVWIPHCNLCGGTLGSLDVRVSNGRMFYRSCHFNAWIFIG